jgi:hypothetical protein
MRFPVNEACAGLPAAQLYLTLSLSYFIARPREDFLPIVLHTDQGPAVDGCCVERRVEPPEGRASIVGIFADGVHVMHDQRRSTIITCQGRPANRRELSATTLGIMRLIGIPVDRVAVPIGDKVCQPPV